MNVNYTNLQIYTHMQSVDTGYIHMENLSQQFSIEIPIIDL